MRNLLSLTLTLGAAALLHPIANPGRLYGLSTGNGGNKLGDVVAIDAASGKVDVIGSMSNCSKPLIARDIVRSADGKHDYAIELEIGNGWAKSWLLTIDATSLKVERTVLLGVAFDALVIDERGRLLAADYGSHALVALDPASGASTVIGHPGSDYQFASLSREPRGGKLLGLARVMSTGKSALVRIDPTTGNAESSVEILITEVPTALAFDGDGKVLVATQRRELLEVDPTTGQAKLRAPIGNFLIVGMHGAP